MKWMRGYILCHVKSGHWERFMNMCRHHNIKLWKIKIKNEYVFFRMFAKDYGKLCTFVPKTMVVPHICEKRGFPFITLAAKRNWTFTIGLLVFFLVMKILSLFVWEINFSGQREYTKETLAKEVKELGVYPGMMRKNLNCDHIERSLRERYDNMSWVSAEEKGCVLSIKIKEGTAEKKVDEEKTTPTHLVAPCDGTVQSIVTKTGTPMVKKDQKVKKGDILISGIVEILDDSKEPIRYEGVCADGEISIVSNNTFHKSIKESYIAKNKTGKIINVYVVRVNGKQVCIKNPVKWFDNSANYDIISNVCVDKKINVFNSQVYVLQKRYVEYNNVIKKYSDKEAKDKFGKMLQSEKMRLEEEGCVILDCSMSVSKKDKAFEAKGKIQMKLSKMDEKAVSQEELLLKTNGKEDEDGSGTENS